MRQVVMRQVVMRQVVMRHVVMRHGNKFGDDIEIGRAHV